MAFPKSLLDGIAPDHPNYDYERNALGEMRTEVLEVPLSECKIIFMQPNGDPVLPGHLQGQTYGTANERRDLFIRHHGFLIEHPDIDPMLVKAMELKMEYIDPDMALVKIEVYVAKKIE